MRKRTAALVIVACGAWSLESRGETPQLPPPPSSGMSPSEPRGSSSDASSFRRLEVVYLNAEVGGAYANVGTKFTGDASQGGLGLGLGAGVRFFIFTAGIRGRIAPLPAYTLIEANLELGIHVPLGAWDPYFNFHGGYADAAMNSESNGANIAGINVSAAVTPPSPHGGDFGASIGSDYYFSSLLSMGLDLTLDALFLSTSSTATVPVVGNINFGQSGTGVAFMGSLHFGFHFNL